MDKPLKMGLSNSWQNLCFCREGKLHHWSRPWPFFTTYFSPLFSIRIFDRYLIRVRRTGESKIEGAFTRPSSLACNKWLAKEWRNVWAEARFRSFAFLTAQTRICDKSPNGISTTFCKRNGTVPTQPL